MRRLLCILLILCFLPAVGCTDGVTADDGKLHVVATTFPAYDFDSEFILRKGKKVFIKITK